MKDFFEWVKSLFLGKRVAKKNRVQRREKSHFGSHYYLGNLLENMDMAAEDFRLLRQSDVDAYKMFRRVGCSVANSDVLYDPSENPWLLSTGLPSFACVHHPFEEKEDADWMPLRFSYFLKFDKFVNVQPHNGQLYIIGAIYRNRGKPALLTGFASVDGDGNVRALKQAFPRLLSVGAYRMTWGYGMAFSQGLDDDENYRLETEDDVAQYLFNVTANAMSRTESGIKVRATKGHDTLAFAVDMERTPYFFSDRLKVKTETGKTKPIFHIVRGHKRTLAGGHKKHVRTHFRGLRKFQWNGYNVSVSVPGRDHAMLDEFTATAHSEGVKGGVNPERLGEIMARNMEADT